MLRGIVLAPEGDQNGEMLLSTPSDTRRLGRNATELHRDSLPDGGSASASVSGGGDSDVAISRVTSGANQIFV